MGDFTENMLDLRDLYAKKKKNQKVNPSKGLQTCNVDLMVRFKGKTSKRGSNLARVLGKRFNV